ncbi:MULTISPECIES: crotonase/enoyl-CoA hydratase family protein [Falsihalocynthiibacter]|uniref:crotonase/enoyl-CoA hydratase family protein n=1 Tax=Falsihalocynthiibacter TaxID=2854182 RepID=UPI003002B2CD
MFETITIETDGRGVATLTLNRPDKHNALSAQMIDEVTRAAGMLGADDAVRVVVLTGAGRSFCAGGDLGWMQQQIAADAPTRRREAAKLAYMLQALNTMPKPLIGKIQGAALGGGIGMVCVCDIAIGVEGAKFGLTETKLGLIPATIGPYVLARMGEARARRVFMNARIFLGVEAVTLGILARAVAVQDLDAAVEAEVVPYLACGPKSVAAAKALARQFGPVIDAAAIDASIDALIACWDGAESAEGIAAFFEKRAAAWVV